MQGCDLSRTARPAHPKLALYVNEPDIACIEPLALLQCCEDKLEVCTLTVGQQHPMCLALSG